MTTPDAIDFTADFLRLDDLCERVEYLEDLKEDEDLDEDDAEELETLIALLEDLRGNGGDPRREGDWYPSNLIHRSAFVDYCRELVSDIGDLPAEIPAYLVIDWDATAANLEEGYSSVEVEGEEYLYR